MGAATWTRWSASLEGNMTTKHPVAPSSKVPVPSSISPEAQQYLASAVAFGDGAPPADLGDVAGWIGYVEARDRQISERLGSALPADLPLERGQFELDGVTTYVFRPTHVPAGPDTPIYIDIHGGGLIMGGGEVCRLMASGGALGRRMITWAVDYRMPPLHPFPAGLDDVVAVYRKALQERPAADIFVGGGSAGGNLAAALILRAKDEGLPMPAAVVLGTPEVDLTESGDSFHTNLAFDHVLSPLMQVNLLYADGHDLSDPYLSPLFGDLAGFPPTYLQTGTRDLFLSNTVRMHRRLRAAGVAAELHVGEAMPHGGFLGTTPEDRELAVEQAGFLERHRRR